MIVVILPELHYTLVILSGIRVQHQIVEKKGRKKSFVSVIN